MIYAFYGTLGQGKSLSATALAIDFSNYGYTIHSNYAIYKEDNNELIDQWRDIPLEQLKMGDWRPRPQSVIVIDELDRYADPRRSLSDKNIHLDRLVRDARKLKTHLIFTTHFRRLLDVRLEETLIGGWGYEIDCKFHETDNKDLVVWMVTDWTSERPKNGKFVLNAEKYYGRYDTDELIGGFSP